MPLKKKTPEQLKALYDAELYAALEEGLKTVRDDVAGLLRKGAREIIAGALGFEIDSWSGSWRVSHANSRQTAIANEIGLEVRAHIKEHFPAFFADLATRSLDKYRAAMKREFDEQVERLLREEVSRRARDEANRLANELFSPCKDEG